MSRANPFFVFGCQRSGTTVTLQVFERCPDLEVFAELDPRVNHRNLQHPDSDGVRLRSREEIEALLAQSPRRATVMKPLMDCHYADQILDRHDGRGFWLYRHYDDVASSAVAKWGDHMKQVVDAIHGDDWGGLGWRVERLSHESIRTIKRLWRPDLTAHEGAVVFWMMRNVPFFEQRLDPDPRLLLVRYEDLVADPIAGFGRMFTFMDVDCEPAWAAGVHARSVGKAVREPVHEDIRALADRLLAMLHAAYAAQADRP